MGSSAVLHHLRYLLIKIVYYLHFLNRGLLETRIEIDRVVGDWSVENELDASDHHLLLNKAPNRQVYTLDMKL